MRILTVIVGILLLATGVLSIANAGLSFISLAFPIGVVLVLVGITECIVYRKTIEDEEEKHWILIDGLTTFLLGIVVLTGQLAADIAVPVVFGMWSMVAGIRDLVIVTQISQVEKKDMEYYWDILVGCLSFVIGTYTFFNSALLQLSVLMIMGVIFVVRGVGVIKVGLDIPYRKSELLKSKDEKIAEAEEKARKAHKEAKTAIKKVRKARHAVKEAEESKEFQEIIQEPINEDIEVNEEEK